MRSTKNRVLENRMSILDLTDSLSDEELLARLDESAANERNGTADIIAYLAAVEERGIHLEMAYPSMFAFCLGRLGLSEGAAFRRLTAARLVLRFPTILHALANGRIHLCNIVRLRDLFTTSNVDELLATVAGKTKREVEELVARLAPKPDVKPSIRKLPEQASLPAAADGTSASEASRDSGSRRRPEVVPLSPARYKLELTVDQATRDRLEDVRSLMRHRNPTGDLEVIIREAIEALAEKLEKERLGRTERPRASRGSADPGHVTKAALREVVARDGMQCSFVSADGERCGSRDFLEVDHRTPRALGGTGDPSNLRVLCRSHNQYAAEQVFGRAHVEKQIHFHREKCKPPPAARDVLESALLRMGFRKAEITRAVGTFGPESWSKPLEALIRDALGALT
jgi:hypothetical protein